MGFKWHTHTIWLSRAANSVSVWHTFCPVLQTAYQCDTLSVPCCKQRINVTHFLFGAICTNHELAHLRWCSSLSSFSEHLVGGWSASLSCQSALSLTMMDVVATFGITYSFPHFSKLSSLIGAWQSPTDAASFKANWQPSTKLLPPRSSDMNTNNSVRRQQLLATVSTASYPVNGARCWWRSWLRHRATSRKVAGSIPDCVTKSFHWHNPSGRTIALGLTQPLTEMSTRNISWG